MLVWAHCDETLLVVSDPWNWSPVTPRVLCIFPTQHLARFLYWFVSLLIILSYSLSVGSSFIGWPFFFSCHRLVTKAAGVSSKWRELTDCEGGSREDLWREIALFIGLHLRWLDLWTVFFDYLPKVIYHECWMHYIFNISWIDEKINESIKQEPFLLFSFTSALQICCLPHEAKSNRPISVLALFDSQAAFDKLMALPLGFKKTTVFIQTHSLVDLIKVHDCRHLKSYLQPEHLSWTPNLFTQLSTYTSTWNIQT